MNSLALNAARPVFSRISRMRVIMVRAFCDRMHERIIKMPSVMTAKTGTIDKWLKKEGESFAASENLCELTLSEEDVRIAVDGQRAGVLASILVGTGETIAVNEPIAMFVDNMSEYMEHVEKQRISNVETEMMKEMIPDTSVTPPGSDHKSLLRQIRNMMQQGDIDSSTEFSKELLSLARKGDSNLLSVFEASCDDEGFAQETFDKKFFLSNAVDIVNESLEIKKSSL